MAATVHHGSYNTIGEAHEAVLAWIEANGYRIVGPVARIIKAVLLSPFIGQTMRPLVAKPSSDDLQFLRELIEAGRVTPVIDRTYPLSAAPDAIRYLETGRARGKVVISVKDRSLA